MTPKHVFVNTMCCLTSVYENVVLSDVEHSFDVSKVHTPAVRCRCLHNSLFNCFPWNTYAYEYT